MMQNSIQNMKKKKVCAIRFLKIQINLSSHRQLNAAFFTKAITEFMNIFVDTHTNTKKCIAYVHVSAKSARNMCPAGKRPLMCMHIVYINNKKTHILT